MKYKAILMFVVAATIFTAAAQAQYTPSLMPPRTAHPSAATASINVKSDALALATSTCSYFFTVPGKLIPATSVATGVNPAGAVALALTH